MITNEKIQPIKKKSNKLKMSLLAIPFFVIGYGYSLLPQKDLSDNPPHEDNVVMTKMALNHNFFNDKTQKIQTINCMNNNANNRVCMVAMQNKNINAPKNAPSILLIVGQTSKNGALTTSVSINNKQIDLPDYTIDFNQKTIVLNNLNKAYYSPTEVYDAMMKEEQLVVHELDKPIINTPTSIKN